MCIAPKYKCIIHVENVFIVYELKKCANQSMYFERATYMFISRGNFVASITVVYLRHSLSQEFCLITKHSVEFDNKWHFYFLFHLT